MLQIDANINPKLYPLAWFIGEFEGSGQIGGHFGLNNSEFNTKQSWVAKEDILEYTSQINSDELCICESGWFKVSDNRPSELKSDNQFPLNIEITTSVTNEKNIKTDLWRTQYVGLVGQGKAEILSDKIELLSPNYKIGDCFINDLYRSKRVFGYVNSRVLWAWDLAFLGDGLQSFLAGGLWLKN